MHSSRFTGWIGSRITRQIVDQFLSCLRAERSGRSVRTGRAGAFVVEPLEARWLMSAAPITFRAFLASSCVDEMINAGDDWLKNADHAVLGFDEDTSLYAAEGTLGDVLPTGTTYMLHEEWGGTWCDAEKIPSDDGELWPSGTPGADDDWMCWAAAASNVLAWTGWGQVGGMSTCDEIFEYFQDHWTDEGGWMQYGWDWWFDGTNPSQGYPYNQYGYSQVDVSGGGFYSGENFNDYFHSNSTLSAALPTIDTYLTNGYGTAIGIFDAYGGGHAITVWGVTSDASGYTGIYVSDSDDSKYLSNPPDSLNYCPVYYSGGTWYMQSYYGRDWSISSVQGLEQRPGGESAPPEPEAPVNEIRGVVFDDANANGSRDQGESGLAGRTVFLDANANGLLDHARAQIQSSAARAIADRATTTSTLVVSGAAGAITDLNVTVNISHTYTSDLTAYLISPNGTRVLLFDAVGGSGDNFTNTTLDDEAARGIVADSSPFSGTFRPEGSLAALDGESANGTWTLEITDNYQYDQGTLHGWSLDVSTAETSTTTAADGTYSFADLADGDYRVALAVPGGWNQTLPEAGYYDVTLAGGQAAENVNFGLSDGPAIEAVDLGVVDYAHVDALELQSGSHWYTFQTTRGGYLTVAAEALVTDGATVSLYNDNFELLATSEIVDGVQRVDELVTAGQRFFVCVDVEGSATVTDLYAVNLVERSGSTMTVHGTSGDDEFLFAAAAWHQVTINGVQYDVDSAQVTRVAFDGGVGNDSAVLNGSAGDDTLTARPTTATLVGANYSLSIAAAESIIALGEGGYDRAFFYDSSGNDTFTGNPTGSSLSGGNYYNYAEDFDAVYVYASAGGTDRADLYDSSGNDTFTGKSNCASVAGAGFINYVKWFDSVYAYSTAGGIDRANLYDSRGNDTFAASPDYGVLSGSGYYNYASGFDSVYAYATAGGTDRAKLYDSSGDDTFTATATYSILSGAGYYNYAQGFDTLYAYATAGGLDTANFHDSSRNDTFVGKLTSSKMYGAGFNNTALGFEAVSAQAPSSGSDRAYLYDSAGNDRLIARDNLGQLLYGNGSSISLIDFSWVRAYGTAGGTNTKDVDPTDYVLQTQGTWINV